MDQSSKEETLEKLTKAESILVAVATSAGFDGMASGLAICLSLSKLGKNVSVLSKAPTVGDSLKLYGVDKIGQSTINQNLVLVISDAIDSVDKVTYFLEKDQLKIVVHPLPGPKPLSKEQIFFEEQIKNPQMIFAIGFTSKEDMNKEVIHEQYFDPTTFLINLGHGGLSHNFAQVNFWDPEATSFSEVTAQLIQDLALPIDEDIAYNLYVGITQVTGNFSPVKSTPNSFQIAAWLIKFGAGRASLAQRQSKAATLKQPAGPQIPFPGSKFPEQPLTYPPSLDSDLNQTAISQVETQKSKDDWLKPPKIYKGSKSFDSEY